MCCTMKHSDIIDQSWLLVNLNKFFMSLHSSLPSASARPSKPCGRGGGNLLRDRESHHQAQLPESPPLQLLLLQQKDWKNRKKACQTQPQLSSHYKQWKQARINLRMSQRIEARGMACQSFDQ